VATHVAKATLCTRSPGMGDVMEDSHYVEK